MRLLRAQQHVVHPEEIELLVGSLTVRPATACSHLNRPLPPPQWEEVLLGVLATFCEARAGSEHPSPPTCWEVKITLTVPPSFTAKQ